MSERKPLFSRSRLKTTERADGALTWTFGSLYGLHEEVVGVGLTFINPTALADVHFTTTYSIRPLSVKEKLRSISHYFSIQGYAALKFKDLRAGVAKISQKTGEVRLESSFVVSKANVGFTGDGPEVQAALVFLPWRPSDRKQNRGNDRGATEKRRA